MTAFQIMAVAICVMLNGLDGFDVLSISFASPGIAQEWGVNRAALGIVLSMELIGMAAGSVVVGGIADRIGRRPTIFACLFVMATGMFLAATADGINTLSLYRFFTGLGIGGMLASTNAMAAEFSNDRHRALAVTVMATGYPIGAIVGGSIASALLATFDWRAVFIFGGCATAAFFPLVWLFLPESVYYLAERQPRGALEKINASLRRMKQAAIDSLPAIEAGAPKPSIAQLFSPAYAKITILLTAGYFAHIMNFYFILKWIPKIVVDMGFEPSLAGSVLVWANVGGATGSIILGLMTQRFGVRGLVIGALALSAVMVAAFGQGQADLRELSIMAAAAGFFTNSAIVGLYAMFAQSFPTQLRAGGTGFVIGVGRGGAALGPVVAGFLFESGFGLAAVATAMASGSIVAALALLALGKGTARAPTPA